MATYVLRQRDGLVREYWCPDGGGYVHEVTASRPGRLGYQVSRSLAHTGDMMSASERTLAGRIRRARRRERDDERRSGITTREWIEVCGE